MKKILITRSKIKSKKVLTIFNNMGYETFAEPLFLVQKKFLQQEFLITDFNLIKNIIISSSNSVYILKKLNIDKSAIIYTVGAVTAKKILKLGYKNVYYPSKTSALDLCKLILKTHNFKDEFYYFHGEKISFDIAKYLTKKGFSVNDYIVYKIIEINKFSKDLLNYIKLTKLDEVLIFSTNSFKIFLNIINKHNLVEYFNCVNIICMSSKIAKIAKNSGFINVSTFKNHNILKQIYDTR